MGTWARAPLAFEIFFRYTLKQLSCLVWFGICQTLIQHYLFVQPYSLWNDTITGYNGVSVQKLTLFLTRDAMRYSAVFAVVRCPSVRLSITFVHCIQTDEDIVKHLSRPGSPMILVFDPNKRRYSIQGAGEPLRLGRKIHEGGKICEFRLKSPSISETIPDRPIIAMER